MIRYCIFILVTLGGCKGLHKVDIGQTSDQVNQGTMLASPKYGYQSLSVLKYDTLNYARTFIDRKHQYIGKELNALISDLEMPIKGYLVGTSHLKGISPGLSLQFYDKKEIELKKQNRINPVIMTIIWQTPLPMDSVGVVEKTISI